MAQDTDVLWGLYQEQCEQARHQKTLGVVVNIVFLTLATLLFGVIVWDQKINTADMPVSLFMVFLGGFGAFTSAKFFERFEMHMERARTYRDALEGLLPTTKIKELKSNADTAHRAKWPRLSTMQLYGLEVGIQLAIALFGLLLSGIAMFGERIAK